MAFVYPAAVIIIFSSVPQAMKQFYIRLFRSLPPDDHHYYCTPDSIGIAELKMNKLVQKNHPKDLN